MRCKRNSGDGLMKALVEQGINLILPPRDHVEAGCLILAEPDNSIRTGSWEDVFGVQVAPVTRADSSFRAFMFEAASSLNVDASASLLGSILQTFGLAAGTFKGAFGASKAAMIELTLVAPANKTLLNFDEILTELDAAKAAPTASYQEKRFCVATKIWRARGLRLRVLDKSDKQVDLTVDALENLSASTKLSITQEDRGSYAFTAQNPQIFGMTLRELVPLKDADGRIMIGDRRVKDHMTLRNENGAERTDAATHAFIGEDAFLVLPET